MWNKSPPPPPTPRKARNFFKDIEVVHPVVWTIIGNTFISEINFQNLKKIFFLTLQKPRLPQEIVSLMWILKVTDLAIVASLVTNTRSVPLGKWQEVIKENEWLQDQSSFVTSCDCWLSPPKVSLFKLTILQHKISGRLNRTGKISHPFWHYLSEIEWFLEFYFVYLCSTLRT